MIPGGRAIVQNADGELLFHRRSDLGIWELPGGGAEIGESAESCVVREVLEETGLTIEQFVPVGLGSDPVDERVEYPNGDVIQGFSLLLAATSWSGSLRGSHESTELRFIAIGELSGLRPNIASSIAAFVRFSESGEFQLF